MARPMLFSPSLPLPAHTRRRTWPSSRTRSTPLTRPSASASATWWSRRCTASSIAGPARSSSTRPISRSRRSPSASRRRASTPSSRSATITCARPTSSTRRLTRTSRSQAAASRRPVSATASWATSRSAGPPARSRDTELNGFIVSPYGNRRAGFSAKTSVDRRDYGLTWNTAIEAGGFVVGDKVESRLLEESRPCSRRRRRPQ